MNGEFLGTREYGEVWALQKELVGRRALGEIPATLLLVEHPPVYTLGSSSKNRPPASLPHPLHVVERGGDITYHGPGQLVGYPILGLKDRKLKPRSYLRTLEDVIISALKGMGLEAERLRGFTGVWVRGRKVASIGVAVQGDVSFHGFSLNVNCDLEPFRLIYPCRLEPGQMTTVESLLGRPVAGADARRMVTEAFLSRFGN